MSLGGIKLARNSGYNALARDALGGLPLVPNMRISAGLQVGSPAKDKHAYSLGPVATQSGNARF